MANYQWLGIAESGQKISGTEPAVNSQKLQTALQARGIAVLQITKISSPLLSRAARISAKKIAVWTRQLAILAQANMELTHALAMTMQQNENSPLSKLINSIKLNVENGMSFADALRIHPDFFDKVYCSLIQAGEQSGQLDKILIQLADYQEQALLLQAKIAKALFYPIMVTVVALLVTAGLLIFVVPQFKNIFNSFHAQLPAFTQIILQISSVTAAHFKTLFLLILTAAFGFRYCLRKFVWLNNQLDKQLLKIPVLGHLLIATTCVRWTRILATLLNAGLSLVEALQITAKTISNQTIQMAMLKVIADISSGAAFYKALNKHSCFPSSVVQIISVGENGGQLALMLAKAAESEQYVLDRWIDYLSKWLEPAIMMVLAVVTGSLIIAMYLPVFKLGSVM
jgi:type IV pilus assembly protein PilC